MLIQVNPTQTGGPSWSGPTFVPAFYASVIGPGWGTPGKGGDFVQDPVEVLDSPLLEGETEQSSKFLE